MEEGEVGDDGGERDFGRGEGRHRFHARQNFQRHVLHQRVHGDDQIRLILTERLCEPSAHDRGVPGEHGFVKNLRFAGTETQPPKPRVLHEEKIRLGHVTKRPRRRRRPQIHDVDVELVPVKGW